MAYFSATSTGGGKQEELVSSGNVTSAGSSVLVKITTGFKPKMVSIIGNSADNLFYDERISTTRYYKGTSVSTVSLGIRDNHTLYSIDNDGFTYSSRSGSGTNMPYVARG